MSCVICNRSLSELPTVVVKSRALQRFIQCSLIRQDNLSEIFKEVQTLTVHYKCRNRYCYLRVGNDGQLKVIGMPKPEQLEHILVVESQTTDFLPEDTEPFSPDETLINPETDVDDCSNVKLEKTEAEEIEKYNEDDPSKPFPFEHRCLFCAKEYNEKNEIKKPVALRRLASKVTHESTQQKFIEKLMKCSTPQSEKLLRRIEGVNLVAVGAIYHKKCFGWFFYHNSKTNHGNRRGRPRATDAEKAARKEKMAAQDEVTASQFDEDYLRITRTKSKQLANSFDNEMEDDRYNEKEEDGKNISYCHVCLSSDRSLDVIGGYEDVYNKICADIIPSRAESESRLSLVCWECAALLRSVTRFRERARAAQELLLQGAAETFKSLTTLGTHFPMDSIYFEHDENKANQKYEVEIEIKQKQKNKEEFQDLNCGFDDDDDDYFDDTFEKINYENGTLKKTNDGDDKLKSLNDKKLKLNDDGDDSEDIDFDDKNDEDFVIEKSKINKKPSKVMRKTPRYSSIKMLRKPVAANDLKYWMKNEKRSGYYRQLINKCEKCVSKIDDRLEHENLRHSPMNPHVCPVCTQTFASVSELSPHVSSHFYIFSCSVCWYKCYNEDHMKHHLDEHRFHTLHKCHVCNKTYKSQLTLLKHKKKHIIDRCEAAYCVPCDIQFDNVFLFKRHIAKSKNHRHEQKKPFVPKKQQPKKRVKCPHCSNMYTGMSYLRGHLAHVHANKSNFVCEHCGKGFATNRHRRVHVRTVHEGFRLPKNKICNYCGQGFSEKKVLVHHIRTHTGEKPHQCPHCAACFAQKTAMRTHVKSRHASGQPAPPAHTATQPTPV